MARSSIPTYATAADVLSKKTGSGLRMIGWTVARTLLIAPPALLVVKAPAWQIWLGAGLSSVLISMFAMLRIFNAAQTGLGGRRRRPRGKFMRLLPA